MSPNANGENSKKENMMTQREPELVDTNQLLLHASAAGDLDLALAAIEKGANPDCRDPRGFTPLMRAATYGDVGMLQLLVDAGATLDAVTEHGVTALMKAAIHERADAAQELLRCGAAAGLRDTDGFTAKEIAVRLGNNAVAAVL
jgi:ankyrin repeat protein